MRGPDTVRAPDHAFVRRERTADPIPVGIPPISPPTWSSKSVARDRAGEILAKLPIGSPPDETSSGSSIRSAG